MYFITDKDLKHTNVWDQVYILRERGSGSFVIDINFVRGHAKESQSFKIFDLQKLASLHIECFLVESRPCAKHSFDIIKKINRTDT